MNAVGLYTIRPKAGLNRINDPADMVVGQAEIARQEGVGVFRDREHLEQGWIVVIGGYICAGLITDLAIRVVSILIENHTGEGG